jgi:hypothetical protein
MVSSNNTILPTASPAVLIFNAGNAFSLINICFSVLPEFDHQIIFRNYL